MPDDPNAGVVTPDVVKKVVGKAVEVAAPQPAGIKMEKARILRYLQQPCLKLAEKLFRELRRNLVVFFQNGVQICLDSLVKSNAHESGALKRVGQK